jgi:hypothetical protein
MDPAAEDAVSAAIARARALGVDLPPVLVFWVRAPAGADLGTAVIGSSRYVSIYLKDTLSPPQAFETMLHELQHAADHELTRRGTPRRTLERRAEAFATWAQLDHSDLRRPPMPFEEYVPLHLPRRQP